MTRKGSSTSSPRHLSLLRTHGASGAARPERPEVRAGDARRPFTATQRQLGMTLVEVIVAATLALIGFLVALVLYQAARNLFKKGEQATDQQQEVRAGYDMMLKDLRLAGYNWNASGEDRPGEEQIEGAWDGAVTIRADFDFEDATKSIDPESVIAGSTNKATVGNDEIVTYCLRPATGTETTSAVFNADVTSSTTASSGGVTVAVRDGATEAITVSGVATGTTQSNPPYNLYRVTLNNDNSTYGSGNFQTWTLLAQNIKSLQFVYRDANGTVIPTSSLGGTEANKNNRASIKKIDVTIVGMTAVADRGFTDTSDTNTATRNFRKFSLTTQVTPRNLGYKGRPDLDTTPPSTPTGLALCPGNCGAMVAKWNPNPANEAVALYTVKYGTSPSTMNSVLSTAGTNIFVAGLLEDTQYYFQVRATDSVGNSSSYSSAANAAVGDLSPTVTTPSAPSALTATGATSPGGRVTLAWGATTTNTTPLACDPVPSIRDLAGYRLYKSTSPTYSPTEAPPAPNGNLLLDENTLNGTLTTYADTKVVNCRDYYYNIVATDTTSCSNVSTPSLVTPQNGKAVSTVAPEAPTNVTAARTGVTDALVTWTGVIRDTGSAPITIDKYNLWRCHINNGADPEAATYTPVPGSPVTCTGTACTFSDSNAPPDQGGKDVWYKVSALDDCPNESALSSAQEAQCAFNGVVSIVPQSSPPSLTTGNQSVTISAVGGDVYTSATLTISKVGGSTDFTQTITATGNNWNFTWSPNQAGGTYVAIATVTNSNSCVGTTRNTWDITLAACATCATIPANNPDATTTPQYYRLENFVNNSCAFPLQMTRVVVREGDPTKCTHNSCNTLKLQKIQYIQTGSFADETTNIVWTSPVPGGSTVAAPSTSVTADFSPPLDLSGSSTGLAKIRFIFDTTTPVWVGTQNNRQHTILGDFNFNQISSLCAPATVTSQLD
jgi:Tfp pilus assembly protein PilW